MANGSYLVLAMHASACFNANRSSEPLSRGKQLSKSLPVELATILSAAVSATAAATVKATSLHSMACMIIQPLAITCLEIKHSRYSAM